MFMLIVIEIASILNCFNIEIVEINTQYSVQEGTIAIALGTSPLMVVDAKRTGSTIINVLCRSLIIIINFFFLNNQLEPVRDFLSKYKIWAGFASPPTWGESQRSKPQPYIYSARYGGIAQCCVFQRLAGVYLCEWWCVLSWIHFSQLYWNIFS